ncbi:hypothetical protein E3P99_02986 [Wallemia hederae]|uniref:YTH domain-containing protein n=1 Tax=Wallemia hederae TaxID=1540922 RepID=A0A4T0FK26_9BASI|nr:hypothetical protein E3P99_02986 [Wallemia hederae]
MSFPYYSPSGWLFYPALLSPTQTQLSHPTPNLIPQAVQPVAPPMETSAASTKRKSYHPPSSAKSSYCIWVGNVPADSTVDELFKYFSRQSPHSPRLNLNEYAALPPNCGLLSIHLISKSRCCFANFSSPHALNLAVRDFNGSKFRLGTPRLVVRVRDVHSELSSGVGSQRGRRLHRNWVKWQAENESEDKQQQQQQDSGGGIEEALDSLNISDDIQTRRFSRSSSVSSTTTTSSFLNYHFPVRYFILKSHGFEDLLESVKTASWSTQPHNEYILDKAYRSSQAVVLIFSINRSGGWFGYGRMASSISNGTFSIEWSKVQFLPFSYTKLRNPFNGNREVKVSRDGTEVEPDIGKQLTEIWDTAPIQDT